MWYTSTISTVVLDRGGKRETQQLIKLIQITIRKIKTVFNANLQIVPLSLKRVSVGAHTKIKFAITDTPLHNTHN